MRMKKNELDMKTASCNYSYGTAIRSAFEYVLQKYPETFVIGQGLWSPWYVGNSMTDLDKQFGVDRIIDTPVSESACTGLGVGASLVGMRPIVVHPRMDFMLYAIDAIVNQAAKWSHMFGGQAHPGVTIRGIINRGGEQGAQHSQALHAWFAHIPGLRVVMPASVQDARDLLIAAVLSPDPVVYIDDRWLYDLTDDLPEIEELDLAKQGPKVLNQGRDITIVGAGYSTYLSVQAQKILQEHGILCEVIDMRVVSPLDSKIICESVSKTGRLIVVDGSWSNCGLAGEIIASVTERVSINTFKSAPMRITLPAAPAPTSRVLEKIYYPTVANVVAAAKKCMTSPN
jgi:pyruvate dehydrogenase E1 component beta subunit